MKLEEIRQYCLAKPGVSSGFPFNETAEVFKVAGKMFASLTIASQPLTGNLKGEPNLNTQLRLAYPDIIPAYHMNKEHWNTINFEGTLGEAKIRELIDQSYECVKAKLPKTVRESL